MGNTEQGEEEEICGFMGSHPQYFKAHKLSSEHDFSSHRVFLFVFWFFVVVCFGFFLRGYLLIGV